MQIIGGIKRMKKNSTGHTAHIMTNNSCLSSIELNASIELFFSSVRLSVFKMFTFLTSSAKILDINHRVKDIKVCLHEGSDLFLKNR